ncbi:pantoate--beta-alanine ligase [Alcanivorax sp. JB21]|uniref:pantoate--beta-alanine ligase n=1 Tax=Alcanivorax limicola TaxID=2874102 RepID=UPI001CBEB22F|nr:pantoate--beta-alanine ligase [Alcanivorax limicola]MBZ2189427.1 pantoate--beta-alanine ligase [Alcanivorax limicola]
MLTLHTIADTRAQVRAWQASGLRVGFVPTMGNLHAGHIRLVTEARRHADKVVASIFVNPTQFGPGEDFDAYPRTLERDQARLADAGTDLLFAPAVDEMYPQQNLSWVDVDQLGEHLCGASRPGHFRGVSTVVSKLFHIVTPDVACFGEKDFQQLAVIRRMTRDLCFGIDIVGVATEREADGLAMSSRNGYLSPEERALAPQVYAHLQQARAAIEAGDTDYQGLSQRLTESLESAGFRVDYLDVVNAETVAPATPEDRALRVAVAARLGKTRLIDNIPVAIVRD